MNIKYAEFFGLAPQFADRFERLAPGEDGVIDRGDERILQKFRRLLEKLRLDLLVQPVRYEPMRDDRKPPRLQQLQVQEHTKQGPIFPVRRRPPATHTPGEWAAPFSRESYEGCVLVAVVGDGPGLCYRLVPGPKTDGEAMANARLIAAAPDLLEAAKELVRAHDLNMGANAVKLRIERAKDAIAKAVVP